MTTPEQFIDWVKQTLNIRKTPAVEKAAGLLGVTRLTIFRWLNGTMPPQQNLFPPHGAHHQGQHGLAP